LEVAITDITQGLRVDSHMLFDGFEMASPAASSAA